MGRENTVAGGAPWLLYERGFTILEILIALMVASVFITAISSLVIDQAQRHEDHQMTVVMQQNGRAILAVISNELMIAGYSPDPAMKKGVVTAAIDEVVFDYMNREGVGETVGYSYIRAGKRVGRRFNGGLRQSLVRGVAAFKILYAYDKDDCPAPGYGKLEPETGATYWAYDSDSDSMLDAYYTLDNSEQPTADGVQSLTTPSSIARIRAVKIWILMRSDGQKNRGSSPLSPGSLPGVDLARLDTDHYSYRLYTTTVKLRNMYY